VYVDDLLLYAPDGNGDELLKALQDRGVTLEVNGVPKTIVGVDFKFSPSSISLSQDRYCRSIPLSEGSAPKHPLPLNVMEEIDESTPLPPFQAKIYQSLLGSFAYLALTRPDLCYAISYLGKFSQSPTERSLRLIQGAIRYAQSTSSRAVSFKLNGDFKWNGRVNVVAWCDASYGNFKSPYAQTGYAIRLGVCEGGGLMEWRSGKQTRVARSTLKAELESLHECIDRVMTLCFFLRQIGVGMSVSVFTDSDNLVKLLAKPCPRPSEDSLLPELMLVQKRLAGSSVDVLSDKEVHALVVPMMATRGLISDCSRYLCASPINVEFIPGVNNPADVLTKPRDVESLSALTRCSVASLPPSTARGGVCATS
jgi:hypothetical protein